ncbi:hypothetical protein ERJ75_000644700 [Trypanosoma vivax]|nr:hypothetical protein ERJ75_000644700 [Trypanosoma vivax]
MGTGRTASHTFLSDPRRVATADLSKQVWPTVGCGPGLVCSAIASEGGRVAMRLMRAKASRCGEVAALLKEGFVGKPRGHNALAVDRCALPKALETAPL